MKYKIVRNKRYDFIGERYGANLYPNIHQYPATMIPQIGIEILKEFKITNGNMLDPYCGSGSSFVAGMDVGIKNFTGYDINPLALLICESRFTYLDFDKLQNVALQLEKLVMRMRADPKIKINVSIEKFKNFDYWFSEQTGQILQWLKEQIIFLTANNSDIKKILFIPLSTTMRKCSYVRDNEFKLYRINPDDLSSFKPPIFDIFIKSMRTCVLNYNAYYLIKLKELKVSTNLGCYKPTNDQYDVVLTSPPYGDSKTTVAYGQFSLFTNAWLLEDKNARAIDNISMGGGKAKSTSMKGSIINNSIEAIKNINKARALEVISFYHDLKESIQNVAKSLKVGAKAIYIVGNRTVKNQTLPTDQFIAECFEENDCYHKMTYQRSISNKRMPLLNSPSNKPGRKATTMTSEFIVVCEKHS